MPPALVQTISDDDLDMLDEPPAMNPPLKYIRQSLVPVIPRSPAKAAVKPEEKANQYPDGPLPLRPSIDAPRKAQITGRVADDDGVYYSLKVGNIPFDGIKVDEILDFVSAYDLEEYENAQFIEEEEARKIAKAAAEAEREARRLRKLEKIRKKGLIIYDEGEDLEPESNDESETARGRHGRARPTYTHLYKVPGKRRRRKRDPITQKLLPLSGDEDAQSEESSADEIQRPAVRSTSRTSPLAFGLQPPKRRRRKRHPITRELMPLSSDDNDNDNDNAGSTHGGSMVLLPKSARSSSNRSVEPPFRSSIEKTKEQPARSASALAWEQPVRSSPARRASPAVEIEVPKRRRRRRDPITGLLMPLDNPAPDHTKIVMESTAKSRTDGERIKRPRRRRHPITGELMPLGWVYNPKAEAESGGYEEAAEVPSSMQRLSITPRDSKRVKLTSEPSSQEKDDNIGISTSAASPQVVRKTQVVDLESSESEDDSSNMQLSLDTAPTKPAMQVRSPPKHGMMQRAQSSSSSNEPITLASFLSTNARGKANAEESSEDSDSEQETHDKTASGKTSMMNPVATQEDEDEDEDEEESDRGEGSGLDEGEWFVEGILAHHMSDPRTHPGVPQTMLYQTKWEGYPDPTWEPADSFPDPSIVEGYRKRVGLK